MGYALLGHPKYRVRDEVHYLKALRTTFAHRRALQQSDLRSVLAEVLALFQRQLRGGAHRLIEAELLEVLVRNLVDLLRVSASLGLVDADDARVAKQMNLTWH